MKKSLIPLLLILALLSSCVLTNILDDEDKEMVSNGADCNILLKIKNIEYEVYL